MPTVAILMAYGIGSTPFAWLLARLWGAALAAAALAWGLKLALPDLHRIVVGVLVLGAYGAAYFGATRALGIPESAAVFDRLRRIGGGRSA